MKRKTLLIMTGAVLFLCAAFMSVFGILYSSRRKNAFAFYKTENLSEGVFRYICYEMQINVVNTFLDELGLPFDLLSELSEYEYENGKTYGDLYQESVEARVRSLLVCSYLFDTYEYTVDEDEIDEFLSSYVSYKSPDGTKKGLKDALSAYGFDDSDLKDVLTFLYKESRIEKELYGESGEKLKNDENSASALQLYATTFYHGAKLLFIRTEDRFYVSENGTVDTESEPIALTTAEIVDRQADIQTIRAAIEGQTATAESMDTYVEKYKNDGNTAAPYYFYEEASFTQEFCEGLPTVATAAFSATPGTFTEVAYDGGICFILGVSVSSDAYRTAVNTSCFSDFYALCADYLFTNAVNGLVPDVEFTEKYLSFDIFSLPYDPQSPNYYVLSFS